MFYIQCLNGIGGTWKSAGCDVFTILLISWLWFDPVLMGSGNMFFNPTLGVWWSIWWFWQFFIFDLFIFLKLLWFTVYFSGYYLIFLGNLWIILSDFVFFLDFKLYSSYIILNKTFSLYNYKLNSYLTGYFFTSKLFIWWYDKYID